VPSKNIQAAAANAISTIEKKKPSSGWFHAELKKLVQKRQVSKQNKSGCRRKVMKLRILAVIQKGCC